MLVETDLTDVPVVVLGAPGRTGAVTRRYRRAGARVTEVTSPAQLTEAVLREVRLGVVVDSPGPWPELTSLLRRQCLVVTEAGDSEPRGRVVLVGAGPGGRGMLTLAGAAALADADVVLADRLATVDVRALAPGAEILDVGKTPGHHAVPQRQIEALLVERARRGLTVVRLKGGDPYVFGRGGEEVAAAVAAGVPVTVVPGVTSAVSVPAAVGIPVTHRGLSHVFTVVSGHVPLEPERARALVGLGGTVVLLMAMHSLVQVTAALERAGMPARTPAAIVERGYTAEQASLTSTLGELAADAARAGIGSPAVVVVGEVVRQSAVWQQRVLPRLGGAA
ncbi:MAG TPA: uroporphyrinogen-III C-methyltransferase [Intrasporangium sp.]|uniref:uroporphyrinogen-III C-methyltransferase n=1 Tax=Intrasporangium sp. TaxID=1925024 RepID=UPI002D766AB6|nr:uroporphyrinogen-III C-methyltransferase [Intrasporangium sp.]HET7400053.1 uroporphyrinogen-III C-methyltransferase [Intrasporangium sp.]